MSIQGGVHMTQRWISARTGEVVIIRGEDDLPSVAEVIFSDFFAEDSTAQKEWEKFLSLTNAPPSPNMASMN